MKLRLGIGELMRRVLAIVTIVLGVPAVPA
jgi:hypothetical protein